MPNELTDFDETIKERSAFLKTLCILTFIYSSFTIISNCVTLANPERTAKMIAMSKKKGNDDSKTKSKESDFSKTMMSTLSGLTAEKLRNSAIGNIVSSVLCLAGALLMWRLKKIGYTVYIVGIALSIGIPFYLFGNNFVSNFMVISAVFFGVLFIIFYGMNLKSMR